MEKSVCIPSEYINIISHVLTKNNIFHKVEYGTSTLSREIPLEKKVRQYDEIALSAPEEDDMESIMEYPDESKKQIIDHFSYNIVDFAQSEEFIMELCKKVINSEEENKEFMEKWIEENVF